MSLILKLTALALVLGSGCTAMARSYPYRVVIANLSGELITENRVLDSSQSYNYGCGDLISFGYAANAGPMETAPNDIFTVRWKDEKKQAHEQKIDLRQRVKRGFKGEIVFIFGADKKFTVEICEEHRQYKMPPRPKS